MYIQSGVQGFSRLKGIFRSGINFRTYPQIIGTAKRKVIGNLPKDMLSRLVSGGTKQAKREAILGVQNAFEDASRVLAEHETLATRTINNIPESYGTFYRDCLNKLEDKRAVFSMGDVLSSDAATEICIRAEEAMLKGIKQFIPEANNVIITPLGSGCFGIGYRVEVLGKNKEKLFSDKVIKVFYGEKLPILQFDAKMKNVVSKLSDRELLKARKAIEPKSQISTQEIRECYTERKLTKVHKFAHGAYAEANTTEYLKSIAKGKTNFNNGIILPDMYNLGDTKFAISEYIDGTTSASREFKFGKYGLKHNDLMSGGNNRIGGACIDVGGITPLYDNELEKETASYLFGNKSGIKMCKKVGSGESYLQRKKIFNQLEEEVYLSPVKDKVEQQHRSKAAYELRKIIYEMG